MKTSASEKFHYAHIWIFVLYLLILSAPEAATGQNFSRPFQPVVITGETFPQFAGVAIQNQQTELFLYAYRAGLDRWEQIPYQFDERAPVSPDSSYFVPDDGVLDDDDELVFMPADAGDQAFIWIDDEDSQQYIRYEIKLTDPLSSAGITYAYLYRSATLSLDPGLTDYVDYFPDLVNSGADTIRSQFYEIANNTTGFPEDLKLFPQFGPQQLQQNIDILDRLKFRANGTAFGFVGFTADENGFQIEGVQFVDGLVRVIRRQDAKLTVDASIGPDQTVDLAIPPAFFYPYSTCLSVGVPDLSSFQGVIDFARMSLDLDPAAIVTTFVSPNNPSPGLTIDGKPESAEIEIDPLLPFNNWMYLNGNFGSLVYMFPFSTSIGDERKLFYRDDSSIRSGDTGDMMAIGESGIEVLDNVTPPFSFVFKGYFLDSGEPTSIAASLAAQEEIPLSVSALAQDFGSVPVELVSFEVTIASRDIYLKWLTATESNNFGFEIERRSASPADWKNIGFVEGQGTVTTVTNYEYVDTNLRSGTYSYRLKQIDTDGAFEYSTTLTAIIGIPEEFVLHQNYPNPFNPSTTIVFEIPALNADNAVVRTIISIYNLLGQEVRRLLDAEIVPGHHSVEWEGTDNSGKILPSGIYIYRLRAGDFTDTKKMLFVR